MLPELSALPGHVLWRARMTVAAHQAAALPPEIDLHAHAALYVLDDGASRSQQALAEATAVSRTTIGTVVSALVADGLVERVRDPDDARSYQLTQTAAGAAEVRRWAGVVRAASASLVAGLTPALREELVDLLGRASDPVLHPSVPGEMRASVGFLVVRLHERLRREATEALTPLGIEPRHVGSLVALGATGPVPQADLARHLGLSAARVVQLVDDLEARHLLARRPAPGDRRTHLLHRTSDAEAVVAEGLALISAVVDRTLAALRPEERDRLVVLLSALVETAH